MPHKFDPNNIKKLEYPERFTEEPFTEINRILPINNFSSILELGCGSGFYTLALAHYSAKKAKVYALDIESKMLDYLRANMKGGEILKPLHPPDVKKILPSLIKVNEFPVSDKSIDLFFCAKVFHEIDGYPKFFSELSRIMGINGVIFILDWKKEAMERGPPIEHRVDIRIAIELFKKNKFQIESYGEIFTYYYYIIAKSVG